MSYDLDPVQLSSDQRVAAVVAAEREIARIQARQLRFVAALSDDPYAGSPAPALDRDWMREELRAARGGTNAGNLLVLCARHHHAEHDGGWTVRRRDDDSVEWTSPLGRSYVVGPASYPIDTTYGVVVSDDNDEQPSHRADRAA